MSFDQLSSLEAGAGGRARGGNGSNSGGRSSHSSAPYADDPKFVQISQELENKLFRIGTNISKLRDELNRRDTPRTRERMHNLLEDTRRMFQSAGEGLQNLQAWDDVTPTQKYKQQRLSRQLKESIDDFRTIQNRALEKQKIQVADARAHHPDVPSTSAPDGDHGLERLQLQEQENLQLAAQDDVDFQDALIREREQEIQNIEQGVSDLNVLFQQVAQIVTEQGEQLNTITDNVEDVYASTQNADYELRQASRYQKNARSKMCVLLIVLAVILTIIVLAIVLS